MWQSLVDFCSITGRELLFLYVFSDFVISAAYFSIPASIAYVFYRRRQDLPFHWLFVLFALFIFSCGATHLAHVATNLVRPFPWTEGWIRAFTAAASAGTALALWVKMPTVMIYPTARQYQLLSEDLDRRVRERTAELEVALRDKDLLLNEVHHRVKNNLQVIVSMMQLQARQVGPEVLPHFRDAMDRIYAMARVHEQLQATRDAAVFNVAPFLQKLGDHLGDVYGSEGRIHYSVQAVPVAVQFDQATPLALVLTEVLSNAFKHAFPAGRSGRIHVDLEHSTGGVLIRIRDDGVGFNEDRVGEGSTGSRIIKALSGQLRAKTTWAAAPGRGTVVEIDLPEVEIVAERLPHYGSSAADEHPQPPGYSAAPIPL